MGEGGDWEAAQSVDTRIDEFHVITSTGRWGGGLFLNPNLKFFHLESKNSARNDPLGAPGSLT